MKTKLQILSAVGIAVIGLQGVIAQNAPTPAQREAGTTQAQQRQTSATNPDKKTAKKWDKSQSSKRLIDPTKIIDEDVKNKDDETLGDINLLLMDPNSGKVRYAVLEVDQAWNWNEPEVLVPIQVLNIRCENDDMDDVEVMLDSNKERLERAPRYKKDELDKLTDRDSSKGVFEYWAVEWDDSGQATR